MTISECMEALLITDSKYDNQEDKNYYLVHKFMELLTLLKDEDIEEFKDQIMLKFDYKHYSSFREYVCVASKQDISLTTYVPENSEPEKEDTNIIDFYRNYDENLICYIKGHLFLEFAMDKIIEKVLSVSTNNKTFAQKIALLYERSLLSEREKDLLKAINKQRNEIAHNLNYVLTFDIMYDLVKQSAVAGVDFSEETIFKNKKLSREWYGVNGIVDELFPNTFCHLFSANEQYFEDNEIFKYMC